MFISAGSDSHYKLGKGKNYEVGIINGRKINKKQATFFKLIEGDTGE